MVGLESFIATYGMGAAIGAAVAMAAGGFAKGVVGFALPLIGVSLAGSFVPFDVAVALLIVPMLVSNLVQALRHGVGPALESASRFREMLLVLAVMIALSAQLVVLLPERLLFGLLGAVVVLFAASQLVGWQPRFPAHHRRLVEAAVAFVAGILGGVSGIWGPPLVMYLITLNLSKTEMVRVQSLMFLVGSVVLFFAHLHSGVLDATTLPASAWMTLPAMLAMFVGYQVHDRLDQAVFRKATLAVLLLTGLNLLRRSML
ncbi:MAG: sulfite exporter TauE/SafE family protein [Amaricoccus sp.]|uniref:sulfite exporter TauE/SafE family protein n=1 Tax=Amaricoccus sp. TaxID=1872485 RepID=UPI0039E6EA4E